MEAFETDFKDKTANEEIEDIEGIAQFDDYEKELKKKSKEEEEISNKNKKRLKQKLILNSIIPLFGAFIVVIVSGQLISNEIIRDQSDLIEIRVDKTSIGFLKKIGESMTATLMEPLTLQFRMLQKLKNIVLTAEGRDGFNYLEWDSGRYDRYFKKNVDSNKIKIECYSALELVANEEKRKYMQKCLIMNDLYSTVKYWNWGDADNVKKYISKYPSIIIGLEKGHAKNIFHNMTKPVEVQKLKELHPDLIYDLAIVQTLAPYIADEQFSNGLLKYVGFWESSLALFSENNLDITKRKNETAFEGRIPCKGFDYPNNEAAGFDPRCRVWMQFAQTLLESFQKRYGYNFGDFENKVPAYVSPLYNSIFSQEVTEITVCSPQTRIKKDGSPPTLYFTVCQDIELLFLKRTMSRNLLYSYFSLFGEDRINETFQNSTLLQKIRTLRKKIVKEELVRSGKAKKEDDNSKLDLGNDNLMKMLSLSNFTEGEKYLSEVVTLGGTNYLGYVVLIRENYIKPFSGFRKLLYSWENEKKRIEKLDKKTPDEERYLKMATVLNEEMDKYLSKWYETIEKNCGGLEDSLALTMSCNDALVNYDLNHGVLNVKNVNNENSKTAVSITFGDGIYEYLLKNNEEATTTILKIGIVFPTEMLRTSQLKETVSSLLFNLTIQQSIYMLIVVIIGGLILIKVSDQISNSMDRLVKTFIKIEGGENYEHKDDEFLSECREVSEVYSSFILLKRSFDEAYNAFKSGNQTESLLKYSMALSLYKRVNNYQLAGIICNNIGNIHLNSGKIDEAIRMYELAIQYAERCNVKNINSIITRRMNLAMALREKTLNEPISVKKLSNKERMEKKEVYMKMEKIVTELFRFFKEEENNYFVTVYACMLCYIYLQINNFRLSKIFEKNAQMAYDSFKGEKKFWKEKNKFEAFELNKVFLSQEIMLVQAETSLRRGEFKQAADILTLCIKKGTKFSFSIRKRIVFTLERIFKKSHVPLSKNLIDLRSRIDMDKDPVSRNFIFLLDYSKSMLKGNKIENAIKAFLKIWDEHILQNDNVAFIRYNLNPEIVFGLEKKRVNEFSKRHQIELSLFPRDRTALYDSIYKAVKMAKKRKFRDNNTYVIAILDGDDYNSVIEREELCRKLRELNNLMLILVGLGLTNDIKDNLRGVLRHTIGGQLIEPNGSDFDILFQMVSSYVNKTVSAEFFEENL